MRAHHRSLHGLTPVLSRCVLFGAFAFGSFALAAFALAGCAGVEVLGNDSTLVGSGGSGGGGVIGGGGNGGGGVHATAMLGGLSGAVADTVIGATLQERRRCLGCGEYTERIVHSCGSRTRVSRGVPGIGNDAVNFIATVIGSGIAFWAAELLGF